MASVLPESSVGVHRPLPQQLAPPSPTSANRGPAIMAALCRFEFEAFKGNEGTKILMVEWEPSPTKAELHSQFDWEISWEGKKTFLPATDQDSSEQKRVYFLLPPGAPIPPLVTISRLRGPTVTTKPLPAIFPPGFGVSHRDVGKKGVLHTIWAKRRLSELQEEIKSEMKANGESVGLEMAFQEVNWIQEQFGIGDPQAANSPNSLPSPASPRSPAIGKLGEKLRGLKLVTSSPRLVPGSEAFGDDAPNVQFGGWSPVDGDIAVSSFASFPSQSLREGSSEIGGPISLDTALTSMPTDDVVAGKDADQEDDLFALPMSPRSPEMKKSPFSLL